MSNNNGSRIPIHLQSPAIAKANNEKKSESWETFRAHEIHRPEAKWQDNKRPGTHMMSVVRRYANGELDYLWAAGAIIDAVHALEDVGPLTNIQQALLTVVFPEKFQGMMPQEANIKTQFSASEKKKVKEIVEAHFLEEANYSGGAGGGSVPGRHVTKG